MEKIPMENAITDNIRTISNEDCMRYHLDEFKREQDKAKRIKAKARAHQDKAEHHAEEASRILNIIIQENAKKRSPPAKSPSDMCMPKATTTHPKK